MPPQTSALGKRDNYFRQTHRPLNALAFVLPLLLFFHLGTLICGQSNLLAPQDLQRLGHLLGVFGPTANYLPALLVVATLLAMHLARKEPWQIQPRAVAGIWAESALWMLPLMALTMVKGGRLLQAGGLGHDLVTAVGAGIYEEFIFRLAFIGLAMLLLTRMFSLRRDVVALAAVAIAGICFSLYHFNTGQFGGGEPIPWNAFMFRMLAGVYLGGLFLFRGYAIAVGAHAAFDIYAVLVH